MLSLLILIPLFGIMVLNLPFKNTPRRFSFWFAILVFTAEILLAIYHYPIFGGQDLARMDSFFGGGFSIDYLSFIVLMCIGIVSLSSLLVARYTIADGKELFRFINLIIITSIGMSGIVIAKDMFSLYVFLEITAVASFIMIAFNKDVDALEGTFKYLMLSTIATIFMLISIASILLVARDTSFSAIQDALRNSHSHPVMIASIGLFLAGLFIKGGIFPFHGWLPDVYTAAPAPTSILLAGIVTKTAGLYTLMRMIALFGSNASINGIILLFGAASILVGAFAAMGQDNLKRMLAYSSISQVGYIALGIGTGTILGMVGAAFHLFNHSVFKSLLFVNSAAIEKQIGTNSMKNMGDVAGRMPITGATSVIGMLSAGGMPPLAGFWSKLIIILALWQAGRRGYSVLALSAGILTLAYFLMMQRNIFFRKKTPDAESVTEAGFGFVFTAIVLAAITIGTGLLFPFFFNKFIMPIKEILIH